MTLSETKALFKKATDKTESDRELNDLPYEDFGWLHLPCGDAVTEEILPAINSSEADPASGDLKPVFRRIKKCSIHKVSSAPLEE